MPEVTVVIPTRDRWGTIEPTLAGALRQEDVELDVVVVDDASRTPAPRAGKLAEDRVSIVRNDVSRGLAAARNAGIAHAEGNWVAFLDDDDLWSPRKLRTLLDAAASAGAAFAYSSGIVVDERLRVLTAYPAPEAGSIADEILQRNTIPGSASNVIARTSVVRDELGGFDEEFSYLADWDLWIRLAGAGPAAASQEVLMAYVHHGGNMLVTDASGVVREFKALERKHRERARRQGVELDGADFTRYVAHAHRRAGHRGRAVGMYLKGAVAYRNAGNVLRAAGTLLGERVMERFAPPVGGALSDPTQYRPDWLSLYR